MSGDCSPLYFSLFPPSFRKFAISEKSWYMESSKAVFYFFFSIRYQRGNNLDIKKSHWSIASSSNIKHVHLDNKLRESYVCVRKLAFLSKWGGIGKLPSILVKKDNVLVQFPWKWTQIDVDFTVSDGFLEPSYIVMYNGWKLIFFPCHITTP